MAVAFPAALKAFAVSGLAPAAGAKPSEQAARRGIAALAAIHGLQRRATDHIGPEGLLDQPVAHPGYHTCGARDHTRSPDLADVPRFALIGVRVRRQYVLGEPGWQILLVAEVGDWFDDLTDRVRHESHDAEYFQFL